MSFLLGFLWRKCPNDTSYEASWVNQGYVNNPLPTNLSKQGEQTCQEAHVMDDLLITILEHVLILTKICDTRLSRFLLLQNRANSPHNLSYAIYSWLGVGVCNDRGAMKWFHGRSYRIRVSSGHLKPWGVNGLAIRHHSLLCPCSIIARKCKILTCTWIAHINEQQHWKKEWTYYKRELNS